MQVFGLPRQISRGAALATRLAAKTTTIAAAGRVAAVERWRRAMCDGLSACQAARLWASHGRRCIVGSAARSRVRADRITCASGNGLAR